ncbi:hypothetical protein NA57DRAFT_76574 [Rhizodiscina lignyota]|uniref:Uncharacterized protein n=1 Tax=Rhizodiscina lignyota TaxID=1504668 RepID=A0A9P4M4I8_9PEZI|nr:hypothetical protein NA57DRAFT_76574 [Rhizodiscina lignyota]
MNVGSNADQDSGYDSPIPSVEEDNSPEPEYIAVEDAIVRDISFKAKSILSLRSYARAESGVGIFQTFAPVDISTCDEEASRASKRSRLDSPHSWSQDVVRPPVPQAPLCSPTTNLAAQWIFMIGPVPPTEDPLSIFGSFMRLVPTRLGRTPALDAAVACFLSSYSAYRQQSLERFEAARSSNAKAVRYLRVALQDGKSRPNPLDLLITTKLLSSLELMLGIESWRHVAHSKGLTSMMVTHGSNWENDAIGRSIFHSSYFDEMAEGVLDGEPSAFDNTSWFDVASPYIPTTNHVILEEAIKACIRQVVQIPRLICLVRLLNADPSGDVVREDSVDLAESMYTSDIELKIARLMQQSVEEVPTTVPDHKESVPLSFAFESVQVYELLVRYWTARILLCGLIQTLCTVVTVTPPSFDLYAIQAHELEAANNIAKSMDYATTTCPSFPLIALRILLPLQIAFGAWHRLELRALRRSCEFADITGSIKSEVDEARRRKRWCIEMINNIQEKWNCPLTRYDELEAKTGMFSGGALMPWMKRKIKLDGEEKWERLGA